MAAFAQAFTATVSSDGFLVTITDTSNWTGNSEGYLRVNFVRTFLLTDANGQTLATIVLPTNSDVTTYTLTKDTWVNILFTIVGASSYTLLQRYPFSRIYINKLQDSLINGGCDCNNGLNGLNINTSTSFYVGALGIEPVANATGWQSDLDAANAYINLIS
jgi:hypothetical protein